VGTLPVQLPDDPKAIPIGRYGTLPGVFRGIFEARRASCFARTHAIPSQGADAKAKKILVSVRTFNRLDSFELMTTEQSARPHPPEMR
jgi:hypothetical protein